MRQTGHFTGAFLGVLVGMIALSAMVFASASMAASRCHTDHGIAMYGDRKYGPDFTHFDYVNPNAPKGGTVRFGVVGNFDSLNPFILKGRAAAGVASLYDTLMVASLDEPFSKYGLLAETITCADDNTWVEFRLRKEARFHDGKPVTATDVVWSFNTLMTDGAPNYRTYWQDIERVRMVDIYTVRFDFKHGGNAELPLIIGQLPVLPKHYWADKDFTKTTLVPPLGSGQYRIEAVEAGRSITLERVKDYWGNDLPVNRGQNNFDYRHYDYFRDLGVLREAFKAGEYDLRSENVSAAWATQYDIPAVAEGRMIKQSFPHKRTAPVQGFVYNTRRAQFADVRVREALAYAFDFEWSNKNLFHGQYTRTRSYFDNSELTARGLPSEAELALLGPFRDQLPERVLTQEYTPPTSDGSGTIRRNLRVASKLLRAAGYKIKDGKRVHEETGAGLDFEILLVSPTFERIALPFKANLEKLGIGATVRVVDTAQYIERLNTFDFDMVSFSWGQSNSPGNEQYEFWSSRSADIQGSSNVAGIKSPVVDALIEKLVRSESRTQLVNTTRALDRVLQWGFYLIPHWYAAYDRYVYWNRFSMPDVIPDNGVSFNTWWIDDQKDAILTRP